MATPALEKTLDSHIDYDDRGQPLIAGTTMKVIELVMGQQAHGWSPEEIHFQHPYLSMAQIHAALAYYWDHKDELDAAIRESWEYAEKARKEAGESPLVPRLKAERCSF